MIKLSDLTPHPDNPRKITDAQMDKLKDSIRRDPEYMQPRPLVVNKDNIILAGNQRWKALKALGYDEIPDEWVRRVDWDEEKSRRFVITDNHQSGEWDEEILLAKWTDLDLDDLGLELDVGEAGQKESLDDTYTRKIVAPVYEPRGEKPAIEELFDRSKTSSLISEIDKAGLPEDVSVFLRLAAERHTSFHFRKIAEFYCHADAQVQDLMEKSGLVIIDFKKAIEYGFVHMTEKLGELADWEEVDVDA